jgi:DNA polymerase-3 subunit alpha
MGRPSYRIIASTPLQDYHNILKLKGNERKTLVNALGSERFVHLHVHSEFSLLDGAIRIKDLVGAAKAMGMGSVAMTDHGNMYGAVAFFSEAKKAGIKPILGCELYVAPTDRRERTQGADGQPTSYHLLLLAMNQEGYRNLSRLVTLSYTEGFYYHPRVDMSLLRQYNQGLIALSACLKGEVPFHLTKGYIEKAREKAIEFSRIFDKERFFLEIQANKLPEQIEANKALMELAQELSIPLVATNDCHYLKRQDAEAHDVLLCIQTGKTLNDEKRMRFSSDEFFFKSPSEMMGDLPGFDEALSNASLIAERCNFEMEFGKYKYPVFQTPENRSLEEMLTEEAQKGLEVRIREKEQREGALDEALKAEYRERLAFELKVIRDMGFSGYFLIVADFISYARKKGIPVGPGRGSAAGSLAAYALRITDVDPIKYGLLFERFLNPERISMPDIDIDFCINGRDEIINYVADKYGRENVSQIITFGTMKARAVIRDVGRSLNIPLPEVDKIAKMVPTGPKMTLAKAMEEEPELKRLEQEGPPHLKRLLTISKALEGLARHASTHASGVVISDRPLVEHLPLCKGTNNEVMTQFTMDKIEELGLIKFDFLGLKTLTVISKTLELIKETRNLNIELDSLPLDDPAVYQLASDGKTTGVFQLESHGMKNLLRSLRPEVFGDLIAVMALYRPGPLGSNMVSEFIEGKKGTSAIRYPLPELEPILKETYGVILYQEQAMQIAQKVASYSRGEADELRKAIGKKKEDVMARHRTRFVEGACARKIPRKTAEELFALIEKFGGYGFNKSHSAAYAMICYQTAYLKAHFPVEFMASLLTLDMGNQDKTIKNIAECRIMGIPILPPDINESQSSFAVVGENIRFGLGAVKNVGLKAVEGIIEERQKNGPFKDLLDFCRRVEGAKVNKRVLEELIQCGAFDFTGVPRASLFASLDDVMCLCNRHQDPNQLSMFGSFGESASMLSGPMTYRQVPEWEEKERLRREKEALGFYITGHPLERFEDELNLLSTVKVQDLPDQEDQSKVQIAGVIASSKIKRTKKGDKMAIIQFEDQTGSIEGVLFPDVYGRCSYLVPTEEPLLMTGTLELSDNSVKVLVQDLTPLPKARQSLIKAIRVKLTEGAITEELLNDLKRIAFTHPGDSRLLFSIERSPSETIAISAGPSFCVAPSPELCAELKQLTGHQPEEIFR